MNYLLLICLCAPAFGAIVPTLDRYSNKWGRLVGGDYAKVEDFPYQAEVYTTDIADRWLLCGGTILSEDLILTAASCILHSLATGWTVHVGSAISQTFGQKVKGKKIVIHTLFDNWTNDYDIALLFLDTPLVLDNVTTKAAVLPKQGDSVTDGVLASTVGWGTLSDGTLSILLQNLTVTIINREECIAAFANYNWLVSERMICASNSETGNDMGYGDVGGPLVVDGVLVGVTSWGTDYYARVVCPGVWTRVSSFVDWINDNI